MQEGHSVSSRRNPTYCIQPEVECRFEDGDRSLNPSTTTMSETIPYPELLRVVLERKCGFRTTLVGTFHRSLQQADVDTTQLKLTQLDLAVELRLRSLLQRLGT